MTNIFYFINFQFFLIYLEIFVKVYEELVMWTAKKISCDKDWEHGRKESGCDGKEREYWYIWLISSLFPLRILLTYIYDQLFWDRAKWFPLRNHLTNIYDLQMIHFAKALYYDQPFLRYGKLIGGWIETLISSLFPLRNLYILTS